MLLSVCIIVRNNITRLLRAINSVQDIADETVVILTEDISVDSFIQTDNIKVYSYHWDGSYQNVRNFALEKVRGEWVLFLNVNEKLSRDFNQLRTILQQVRYSGFYLPVIQIKYEGFSLEKEMRTPQLSLRLFKNKEDYYYSGELYEDITPSILYSSGHNCLQVLQLPILSYLPFKVIPRELDPFSLCCPYLEGEEDWLDFFRKGKVEEAITELEKGYQAARGEERINLLMNLIPLLIKQENFQKAEKRIAEGLEKFPDYSIFHFWRGYFYFLLGENRKAVNYLKGILTKKEKNKEIKGNAYLLLGLAYQQLGDLVMSEVFLNKASKVLPDSKLLVSARINAQQLKKEDILGDEVLFKLMTVYYQLQEYSKALGILEQIKDKGNDKYLFWKGKIMIHLGDCQEAYQSLKKISPAFEYYSEVLDLLWLLNIYKTPHKESRSVVNQIKLLGDTITWNIIQVFNNIFFHGKGVHFKLNSMVARFNFYQRLLYYLDILIEFENCREKQRKNDDPIDIMKEIIENLKVRRAAGDIGLLYYKHRRWEEAYSYLLKDLKNGKALPELLVMADICFKLGKRGEGHRYQLMAAEIDKYYEKVFFGYNKM